MIRPTVTVVVPSYNSEKTIKQSVQSFLNSSYLPKEIIIVNDGSIDKTEEVARSITSDLVEIKVITLEQNSGPAKARNIGVDISTGDIICFAESDGIYSKNYLKYCIEKLIKTKEPAFAGGGLRICWTKNETWTNFWNAVFEGRWWLLKSGSIKPRGGWVFYRKDLKLIGGYNELLREGEDTELTYRLTEIGYINLWIPNVYFIHMEPQSFYAVTKRFFNAGRRTIVYRKQKGTLLKDILAAVIIVVLALLIPANVIFIPIAVLLRAESRIAWYRIWKRYKRSKARFISCLIFPYQYFYTKFVSAVGIIFELCLWLVGFKIHLRELLIG